MACLYNCLHLLPTITSSHEKFGAEVVDHLRFLTSKGELSTHTGVVTELLLLLAMDTSQVACSWDSQPTNY